MNTTRKYFPASQRWIITLLWTALIIALILRPGSPSRLTDPPAPDYSPYGHFLVFAVMAVLWYWSLRFSINPLSALFIALLVTVMIGTAGELAQHYFIPFREASYKDGISNVIGILVALGVCYGR